MTTHIFTKALKNRIGSWGSKAVIVAALSVVALPWSSQAWAHDPSRDNRSHGNHSHTHGKGSDAFTHSHAHSDYHVHPYKNVRVKKGCGCDARFENVKLVNSSKVLYVERKSDCNRR